MKRNHSARSSFILVRFLSALLLCVLSDVPFARAQTAGDVPQYRHAQLNIYPAAALASTPAGIKVDGDLSDWNSETFVQMYSDPQLKDVFSLRFAMGYDAQGLLLGARFTDASPLVNKIDPGIDPFRGWEGDAMQLRFVADAGIKHPIPAEKFNSDAVVHLTLWQYSAENLPVLDVRYGMNFRDPRTLTGAQSGLVYKKHEGGYSVEGRIPWSVLKSTPPQPGTRWIMTVQPLWGEPSGKLSHSFFDIVRAAGFQFQRPDGWGQGYFVKPDEVATTLAQQTALEKKIFAATPAIDKSAAIPVRYTNPQKGFVSLAITDAGGRIVRTLLTKAAREAGAQTELWDGRDDNGQPVPPGDYRLKALTHQGITPKYVTSLMNSGNPAWGNSGGNKGWGGDHGVPIGAASGPDDNSFLLWTFNEGGDYLIQVDPTGQKQWGAHISWGDFHGNATAILYDEGRVYTAKDGNGREEVNKGGLFVYNAKSGGRVDFGAAGASLLVTEWPDRLLTEVPNNHKANLLGLAASPDRIFASLNLENKVVALDKKTYKVVETYDVPRPVGLAYDATRKVLYAVSGDRVVALDKPGAAPRPIVAQGLDNPYGLALDKSGNLFVSTRGKQMQVLVFSPEGKLLRSIGKPGGQASVGRYDSSGLFNPAGLTVDSGGQLWVSQPDFFTKRFSLWDAQNGRFKKDFFGSAAYAPMMAPDPEKPEEVYIHNMRWIVDYETGQARPDAVVYRRGYLGEPMIPGSEQGYGAMGGTFQLSRFGGRTFAYSGHGGVFDASDDSFKPLLYIGQTFPGLPTMTPPVGRTVMWDDQNGDGLMSADEVKNAGMPRLANNIAQFGGVFLPGATFIKERRLFHPSGLAPDGAPIYPAPTEAPLILSGEGPMTKYTNWLDVWPSLQSGDAGQWKEYYAIASLPHPDNAGFRNGGGEDGIFRFDRDGNIRWRYSRVAVDFALKAPLSKTGDIFGALRITGQVQMPPEKGGEIVGIGAYRGYFSFLNEDGLFIDNIGTDNGRGPAPGIDVFYIENFSGYFFRNQKNGKVYLFAGDVDGRILELQGWDTLRRFDGGALTITPAQYREVLAGDSGQGAGAARGVLPVAALTPGLDPAAPAWDKAALAEIVLDEERKAQVRMAYDEKNLYARFHVPDTSPWRNDENDWRFAFKGGDAVDIQLGAVATGEGKRKLQSGDVRVMLSPQAGEAGEGLRATAMWKIVPSGMKKEPQLYKSPTGEESFERVVLLTDVESRVRREANAYTVTVALPWTTLGLTPPARYGQLQGDVGVLLSDAAGQRTTLRRYLFNQDTAIVYDIPNEVRLQSENWGVLLFGGGSDASGAEVAAVTSAQVGAAGLHWAGVAGNSGASGASLVRASAGRGAGGVVLDDQGRIFTGGGDQLLTLNGDGELLWQTPLPQENWVVGGSTFATAGNMLYFIAGPPVALAGPYNLLWNTLTLVEPNLCRVAMTPGAKAEVLVPRNKFGWEPLWIRPEISLTASPGGDKVYLGYSNSHTGAGEYSVFQVGSPGQMDLLFKAPYKGGRVSMDENGHFYLGAGNTVRKFDASGKPIAEYEPKPLPVLRAVPTKFEGTVMLTKDHIWDGGQYGFIGRFTRDMEPTPGLAVQWSHALGRVAQIADGPDGTYYIKSPDALYQAKIEGDKLQLVRRFGALPELAALAVTSKGYVGAGAARQAGMLWFDFDANAAAAPVRSEYPGPVGQAFSQEDNAFAFGFDHGYFPAGYSPRPAGLAWYRFAPEPFNASRNHSAKLGSGNFAGDVIDVAPASGFYFVVDAKTNGLLRAPAAKPVELTPVEGLTLPDGARLTSVSALGSNHLLLVAGDTLHAMKVAANGALQPVWQLNSAGVGDQARFGAELYAAASANHLLVSDSKRQRVLLFRFDEGLEKAPQFAAQFGETDRAGMDQAHLSTPTLVALNGSRAAVYDSGNQRVVKLHAR